MINIKINKPFSFKLFATTIKVIWDNDRMNDKGQYGEANYSNSTITLSDTHGAVDLSMDKIKDTFYHEKVHMILDTMKMDKLSNDEQFVDTFAKLLRQSDETMTIK